MPLMISLLILASLVALPILVLAIFCCAALLPQRRSAVTSARPPCAILIPAHNEAAGIPATLRAILPQLASGDRLIVIADNCTDQTAAVARSLGAEVLERHHDTDRGKGFALAYGVDHLRNGPPSVVLFMDADCVAEEAAVELLVCSASAWQVPVQAVYLMESPQNPTVKDYLSAFAFLTKNLVRPSGLDRLGAPVLLTGTGMAFPWSTITDMPLASGNIVEDMQLGIDLALKGRLPRLCPTARVTGLLPTGEKAAFTQRKRWEHGHLRTLLTQAPRLLLGSICHPSLLLLAADLLIPPLAMLAMLWIAVGAALTAAWLLLGPTALPAIYLHSFSGLMFFAAAALSWLGFGRKSIPLRALLSVPLYMFWKIPIYLGFVTRPEKKWIRTERG